MEYCQPAFLLGANCGAVQIPVADTIAWQKNFVGNTGKKFS